MEAVVPLLKVNGLTKIFGGQLALNNVDLIVEPGVVHGLLGENGSGKSTLIKILSGFHEPDSGQLEVNGVPVDLPLLPGQYRTLGFEFVHQDLGLIPSLSITENLFIGRIAQSHAGFFSWNAARKEAARIFAEYGVEIDPSAPVDEIRPVLRAILAIIRAVEGLKAHRLDHVGGQRPNLLVLDEPTVFLPKHEVGLLFDLVREIVSQGSSVLFVSHDLDEVRHITDTVTVLRDGRSVGSMVTRSTTKRDLVNLILGHELEKFEATPSQRLATEGTALSIQNLSSQWLEDVSFKLRNGEILGLAGLAGSGYEEAVYALFGSDPSATGTFEVNGSVIEFSKHSPRRAMQLGMALVPADRKNDGSVADLSISENMNLTVLDKFFSGGLLKHGKLRENAQTLLKEFDVRPPTPDLDYGALSGGNQQKAMMAKWQQLSPKILLLHEPTQGVDVGARVQIYRLIQQSSATTSTICASSDYEELAMICDRVGIIVKGRLVGFLTGENVTHSKIAEMCMGQADEVSASGAHDPGHSAASNPTGTECNDDDV